jgi:aspartyl-tRNA synthetase
MFKQLIMVAGFDRYFQIAPCFRDEDARADRSPGEFYQLDLEMSFVTQDDVFAALEPVLGGVFEEFAKGKAVTPAPFPRIPYAEAMLKYGSDKPDLRNPIEISDVSDHFRGSGFGLFAKLVDGGNVVRAIPAPNTADKSRKFFDDMNEWARGEGHAGSATSRKRSASSAAHRQEPWRGGDPQAGRGARPRARTTASSSPRARSSGRQARRASPAPRSAISSADRREPLRLLLDRRLPDVRI